MDNLPNAIIVETVILEGIVVKNNKGGFLFINSENAKEFSLEYILTGDATVYYLEQFEDKFVKITGRLWHGKLLADKVELK